MFSFHSLFLGHIEESPAWLADSGFQDASVTQSAMEEALASKMQDGTIGSRMSTLGQAIRSRYLPANPNRQQQ